MAGMLTVVNPRPKHRRKHKKARVHRKVSHRRRRVARALNPVRRRRHHRRINARRHRRHRNPIMGAGVMGTLTKGLALGAGAIGANIATAGVNNLLGANALTGPAKLALKAGVGLIVLPMVLRFVPGGKKFANQVRLGAGIAIALDIYNLYLKQMLPANLQDYEYGSLSGYQYGSLSNWAPQASLAGGQTYDEGVYG